MLFRSSADWIVDLGPDGGEDGGTIVAAGTPEQVMKVKKSFEELKKVYCAMSCFEMEPSWRLGEALLFPEMRNQRCEQLPLT